MEIGSLVWIGAGGETAVCGIAGAYGSELPSSSRGCSRSGPADCAVGLAADKTLLSWAHVILALVTSFHVMAVMRTASRAEAIQEGVICHQQIVCQRTTHWPLSTNTLCMLTAS